MIHGMTIDLDSVEKEINDRIDEMSSFVYRGLSVTAQKGVAWFNPDDISLDDFVANLAEDISTIMHVFVAPVYEEFDIDKLNMLNREFAENYGSPIPYSDIDVVDGRYSEHVRGVFMPRSMFGYKDNQEISVFGRVEEGMITSVDVRTNVAYHMLPSAHMDQKDVVYIMDLSRANGVLRENHNMVLVGSEVFEQYEHPTRLMQMKRKL